MIISPEGYDNNIPVNFDDVLVNFVCHQCGNRFKEDRYLRQHLKGCGKSFNCEYCNKVYKSARAKNAHKKRHHANEVA